MLLKEYFTLANGVKMPKIALGTWRVDNEKECINSVKWAIKHGYIGIDTADLYHNHEFIGKALKETKVDRKNIFITSKMWDNVENLTKEKAIASVERYLKELQTDYLDLLLIHWPFADSLIMWEAFEELYKNKKVRAIGVSNFTVKQLEDFNKRVNIKPMVDQVQLNLNTKRMNLVKYCHQNNIVISSWQTINEGKLLNDFQILELAKKYKAKPAQICFKWALQNDITILPKSVHENRIVENVELDHFVISDEDMEALNARPDCEEVKQMWVKVCSYYKHDVPTWNEYKKNK